MTTLVKFIFFLLCIAVARAQNPNEELNLQSSSETSSFYSSAHSYPLFLDNETHSQFIVGYELNENFLIELQNYYDTYRVFDVQRVALQTKNYISDKLYFVNGVAMERELDKHGFNAPKPRYIMTNGVGYDVNSNFIMEVNHDLNFNRSNYGTYGMPSLLSVKSLIKF